MTLSGGTHLIFNMKFNKQFNYNLYSNQSQSIRDAIMNFDHKLKSNVFFFQESLFENWMSPTKQTSWPWLRSWELSIFSLIALGKKFYG